MCNNSRHYFPVLLLTLSLQSLTAQTLFTYGNKSVSKEEFLRAYNKNNTVEKPGETAYREYLDLYTRFKMKVQAASDARLDTELNQKAELQGFRNQVLENYMKDEASINVLISEASERSKKDIHLSHIYIPVKKDASEQLISEAKNRIDKAYEELKKGKSFEDVVSAYSVDPARRKNKGDIGFITVFTLPYDLENVAYSTPTGRYSKPFRSSSAS